MKRIRTVLTDDHPIVRRGIRNLLEKADDIEVVGEASSGPEALEMIEKLKPDVLLLDMDMPGMNGIEVARELQNRKLPLRILALSAYDDEQYILCLIERDVAGYLTKEEALETIVEAVRGVARGEEGWLSRRITAKMLRQRREVRSEEPEQGNPLTEREKAVMHALVKGWENQRIAKALCVSERTVKFHTSNIYQKLQVSSRTGAILQAISRGWLTIDEILKEPD